MIPWGSRYKFPWYTLLSFFWIFLLCLGPSLALSTTSVGPVMNTWVVCCPKPQRFVSWSSSSCSQGPPRLASWELAWQQEGSCTPAR